MYVDDVLAGAHEISRADQACEEVISALTSGGFSFRKWTSNSKQILSRINPKHILRSEFLEFEDFSNAKFLGYDGTRRPTISISQRLRWNHSAGSPRG